MKSYVSRQNGFIFLDSADVFICLGMPAMLAGLETMSDPGTALPLVNMQGSVHHKDATCWNSCRLWFQLFGSRPPHMQFWSARRVELVNLTPSPPVGVGVGIWNLLLFTFQLHYVKWYSMIFCIHVALIDFGDIAENLADINDSEGLEENALLHQKPRKSHGEVLEGRRLLKNELPGHCRRNQPIP